MKKVIGRFTLALLLMCLGGLLLAKNFISFNLFTSVTFILGIALIFFGLEFIYYSTKKDTEYGLSGGSLVAIILISVISVSSAGAYNVIDSAIGGAQISFDGIEADIDLSGVSDIFHVGSDTLSQTTSFDYTIDSSFDTLTLENKYGDVSIIGEDREDIQVYLVIKEYNAHRLTDDDKELIKQLDTNDYIYYQKQSSSLIIRTIAPMQRFKGNLYKYKVEYTIHVPKDTTLDVENKYAPIKIEGLTQDVTAKNGYDDLVIYNVTGEMDLTNGYGLIKGKDLVGNVNIIQKYDTVELTNVDGNLDVENKYGKLDLKNLTGEGYFDIGYSSIYAENCPSAVDFDVEYSSMDLKDLPEVEVTGKHTPMTIDNRIVAVRRVDINSEYGNVNLKIASETEGLFKLESKYGTITSDLPLNISTSTNTKRVEQQLGTGNIDIDITNKYGNISIKD